MLILLPIRQWGGLCHLLEGEREKKKKEERMGKENGKKQSGS